ncbi:MAG TPA: NAD(P)/FAD-dependent oxidoreductase [Baekduia sp.]|uniref:flavin-containing monooxygenase n=1 Tax=Baekduia sp. TaxID=2600305 RepID=UPI002CE2B216|nr:NAD(P)/FAD-dependent oxidoreductase [Baekduia sp.]HMJ37828.1 NAD(P)/FAD-dependent oxidoreductase [Baekduia sp.]
MDETNTRDGLARRHDALIVGAGFAGLYALHRLRALGLSGRVIEAAPEIGGTWYWNSYPGARCDVDSIHYSYLFSPELDQEWAWSERYAGQPEILSYLNHVADRFGLRDGIELDARVVAARFDEETGRWLVDTDRAGRFDAQFVVMATGGLSEPIDPPFPGLEQFAGDWYQTSRYPDTPVDFTGKRVGFVGTGSSGIQAIPEIAAQAATLTVFQRSPNFAVPGRNGPLPSDDLDRARATYPERRREQRTSPFGFSDEIRLGETSALALPYEEVRAELERRWEIGGAALFMQAYSDVILDERANALIADFVRDKIREAVDDPATAELLCPTDHPLATRRLCVENGYYETYNRDNVELVDVRGAPITSITRGGLQTTEREHAFDTLVFALGYDAGTGPLLAVDIRGRGDRRLAECWDDGASTYLGLMTPGFPNLFIVTGPGSPSLMVILPVGIEQHVDWIAECIERMRAEGIDTVEPTPDATDAWTQHVADVGDMTLFPRADSYYMGANVPGKPRRLCIYLGGFGAYRQRCDEVAAAGYEGFELRSAAS